MKYYDSDLVNADVLIDGDELIEEFKKYTMEELGYDEYGAQIAGTDMVDPYSTPYIRQEYEDTIEIDGKEYEVRLCKTDFYLCGLYELGEATPFEFAMFIESDEMPDRTVGSYMRAPKKYIVFERESCILDFPVTITFEDGTEGKILISKKVNGKELDLLKECIENEEDIDECFGLDYLCERITDEACEKYDEYLLDQGKEEILFYDDATFTIDMPRELLAI